MANRPPATLSNDDFKRMFVEGLLVIDCSEIRLTQNAAPHPKSYAGAGCIRVTPDDGATSRIVLANLPASELPDEFAELSAFFSIKSGRLLEPSTYFRLDAFDVHGNRWTHPAARVDCDREGDALVVEMACPYLRMETAAEEAPTRTVMVFVDNLPFHSRLMRTTRSMARGEERVHVESSGLLGSASGLQVHFDPRAGHTGPAYTEFTATSMDGGEEPDGFEDRLMESIWFCAATMAFPVMVETTRAGARTLQLSRRNAPNPGVISAPIAGLGHELDLFDLMGRYYRQACAHAVKDEFSPLTAKVAGLFKLGGVPLETVALLLSVAVESLLNDPPFDGLGSPGSDSLAEIDKLVDSIKGAVVDGELINRAVDMVRPMKASNASAKLSALRDAGAVSQQDRSVWKDVRNRAAHGSFRAEPAGYQKLFDDINRLTSLVYKLAFLRIDYAGAYLDLSTHGWPARKFELARYKAALASARGAARSDSNGATAVPPN